MKYRKIPVVIDAIQLQGAENGEEVIAFLRATGCEWMTDGASISLPTPEGTMRAVRGDWIIRGVAGEVYPCKPDIFDATYEPVEPWDE